MKLLKAIAPAACLALVAPAAGQTGIDPAHDLAWQENCGWTRWTSDASHPGRVRVHASFLSGFVWGENIGWINLGDGTPANGSEYDNGTGADFGVNYDPGSGEMYGLAWGENVGWINFRGGAGATPGVPAQIDLLNERLLGYAWGENIGWINLNDERVFVGLGNPCPADFNGQNGVTVQDIYDFLGDWAGQLRGEQPLVASADFNGQDGITVQDIYDFLAAWNTGCP